MLRIESDHDGFKLFLGDTAVLQHSRRRPCLSLGCADDAVRQRQGSFRLSSRNRLVTALRRFDILRADSRRVEIRFEGDSLMEVSALDGVGAEAMEIRFRDVPAGTNRFGISFQARAGERIYGCGEQYTRLDLKGSRVPLWTQEQGVGRGHDLITFLANLHSGSGGSWHTTYFPMSAWVSSEGSLCYVDTDAYCVADFRRRSVTRFESWAVPERIVVAGAPTLRERVSAMTSVAGRQSRLPDWTWDGIWLGVQGGVAEAERKVEAALAAGAKVSGIWVQDWCGKRVTSFGRQLMWNWQADPRDYPDLPRFVEKWRARGVRFFGYVNPFLALEGELYREAGPAGYCVKRPDGSDYLVTVTTFPAAMVDLTNPAAFEWIKGVIKREMIDVGMSGWMADFAEYFPVDACVKSRARGALLHNAWPVLWARANREAVEEAGKSGEIAFFMRAGWNGSSRHATAFWAGDQLVNWSKDDGLPSVIPAALSLGFCGVGNWHSDIGGYTTVAWIKRSAECLMRWCEMSAFTPVMRSHEGNRPAANVQPWSDARVLSHLARMSGIFAALKPYHASVADEYQTEGLPPIRHPVIEYEDDSELASLQYQYLYGRDLLVAPALKPGEAVKDVLLPDDEWIHLWSSREFRGGHVSIEAPVGYPAVFFRAASPFAPLFDAIRRDARTFV